MGKPPLHSLLSLSFCFGMKECSRLFQMSFQMWPEPPTSKKVSLLSTDLQRGDGVSGLFSVALTLFDLAVEVDGVHGDGDDVGVAVAGGHDARHLVHQLHGYTCRTHTSIQDQPAAS